MLAVFTMICGASWTKPDQFNLPVFLVKTLILTVLFCIVWYAYNRIMERSFRVHAGNTFRGAKLPETGRETAKTRRGWFLLKWNRCDILTTAGLLALIYLAYLLVFYPGVCNADTANELRDLITGTDPLPFQWYGGLPTVSASLNDHHPVFDTLVFGAFYQIGLWLGSEELGMFLYNLVQIAASALAFSIMLCVMERFDVPLFVRRCGLVFLGGMPFIAMYVICMLKDSLYGVIFVCYFVDYILLVKENPSKGRLVRLIVWSLLLALTKKTGVYLVFLADLFLLLAPKLRKKALWILAGAVLPAVLLFVVMGRFLFPALNVYPGGKQEAIGLPLQQAALVVIEHGDEISEEDREILRNILDYDAIPESYDFDVQDGIKRLFYFDTTSEEVSEFLKLWLRWLPRYPGTYLKAAVRMTGGYFCLDGKIKTYHAVTQRGPITWDHPEWLKPIQDLAVKKYNQLIRLPGIGLLFRLVIYVWWLPLLVFFFLVRKKEWLGCLCFLPIILSVGVLLICPYTGSRYTVSQLYVVPMIAALGWIGQKQAGTGAGLTNEDRAGVKSDLDIPARENGI